MSNPAGSVANPPIARIPNHLDHSDQDPSPGKLEGRIVRYGPSSYGQSNKCRKGCQIVTTITAFILGASGGILWGLAGDSAIELVGKVGVGVGGGLYLAVCTSLSVCYAKNKKLSAP